MATSVVINILAVLAGTAAPTRDRSRRCVVWLYANRGNFFRRSVAFRHPNMQRGGTPTEECRRSRPLLAFLHYIPYSRFVLRFAQCVASIGALFGS